MKLLAANKDLIVRMCTYNLENIEDMKITFVLYFCFSWIVWLVISL